MAFSIQSLLFIASLAATSTDAFVTPSGAALSSRTSTAVYAEAVETSNADFIVRAVEGGEDDPTVVDVAAYRNNMVNPQMMVERAQKKRDSLDTTKEAINGLKAGLLYVGPIIGIGSYVSTSGDNALTAALSNYGE